MKICATSAGHVLVVDVPPALHDEIVAWFRARKTPRAGVLQIPPRFAASFPRHFKGAEVDQSFIDWVGAWYSRRSVMARISSHLKTYRGGYQSHIVAHTLCTKKHGIFADMGAGKSMMALELVRHVAPVVLFTPPPVWHNAFINKQRDSTGLPKGDIPRYYPRMTYSAAMGANGKKGRRASFCVPRDLYAVSPYLAGGVAEELRNMPIGAIVIDESIFMSDMDSALYNLVTELREKAEVRVVMSGYPHPRGIGDLYPQINFLDPGRLGTPREFIDEFATKKNGKIRECQYEDDVRCARAIERMTEGGLVTALRIEEIWDEAKRIPCDPKRVLIDLHSDEREKYDALATSTRMRLGDEEISKPTETSRQMGLRELCSGFVYRDRKERRRDGVRVLPRAARITKVPTKIRVLKKLLTRAAPIGCRGERCIIWYSFEEEVEFITELLDRLGISWGVFKGDQGARATLRALDGFAAGKIQVLLTHQKTAGHGIRLTEARNAIYYSLEWSSERFEQSLRRIWRPPQDREVQIRLLVCKDTIEEDILARLQEGRRRKRWIEELLVKGRIFLGEKFSPSPSRQRQESA